MRANSRSVSRAAARHPAVLPRHHVSGNDRFTPFCGEVQFQQRLDADVLQ